MTPSSPHKRLRLGLAVLALAVYVLMWIGYIQGWVEIVDRAVIDADNVVQVFGEERIGDLRRRAVTECGGRHGQPHRGGDEVPHAPGRHAEEPAAASAA